MSSDLKRKNENAFDAAAWISQTEAARLRGVTRQAIALLTKKNRFRTLKIGGRLLLNRSDVERYEPKPPGPQAKKRKKAK